LYSPIHRLTASTASGLLTNARQFGVALCWLLEPGTWGIAPPPRLNVDFVVNTALFVKTLQVRQQGRLRELHRLWRWPLRSSHGRDQLRISAMHSHARTSAKIDATRFYVVVCFLLCLSPEIARRSSQKNFNREF
jgi:hypothetical protein